MSATSGHPPRQPQARAAATGACGLAVLAAWGACVLASSAGRLDAAAIATVITAYACVAGVVAHSRPPDRVVGVMTSGALLWASGELALAAALASDPAPGVAAAVAASGAAARGAGWLVLVLLLPSWFPDGRPALPWLPRLAGATVALLAVANLVAPTPLDDRFAELDNPVGLPRSWQPAADLLAIGSLVLTLVVLVLLLGALARRWRRDGRLVRQQLLWLLLSFVPPVVLIPFIPTQLIAPWAFALVTLPVPVAIGVALLQRRLYDVQLALSRALTYLALSLTLAATYALVVGGVGAMLQERGATWLPWAAAGVVAVAFAPVRDALQRGVNRLTYGRWSAPAEVLADTGRRLSDAADVPALLQSLTDEMVDGLGLSHASVADPRGRVLASSGTPGDRVEELPLSAYGRPVGALRWSGGELREADRRLLVDVAHQIGGVAHASALVEEVTAARERVVVAAEQERRRLRRDLHDGLGPSLAGLGFLTDRIANRLAAGEPVVEDLAALRAGLQTTVTDVRRVIEGLRPPAVDDLGLYGALAELATGLAEPAGLTLDLTLPEGRGSVPAAVEVAAYRIAQEALTNVVRHAGASRCHLAVSTDASRLHLSVSDDGRGVDAEGPRGVGLASMDERARAVGGRLALATSAHGTTVTLDLPFRPEEDR